MSNSPWNDFERKYPIPMELTDGHKLINPHDV